MDWKLAGWQSPEGGEQWHQVEFEAGSQWCTPVVNAGAKQPDIFKPVDSIGGNGGFCLFFQEKKHFFPVRVAAQ